MGTKNDGFGWVTKDRDEVPCKVLNDAPTRVVHVDWSEEEPLSTNFDSQGSFCDATALVKIEDEDKHPSRRSAQYIPTVGMRKSGEVTAIWVPKKSLNLESGLEFIKNTIYGRLVLLTLALSIVSLSVFLVRDSFSKEEPRSSVTRTELHMNSQGTPTGGGEQHGQLELPKELPSKAQDKAILPPSLKDAADALVDGRLGDALGIYEQLAMTFPEDESFALAVEILSRGKGSGTR